MKIHFIAIGGSIMHQLALVLNNNGHIVTGSDDKIFNPAKSNLERGGILPKEEGWFPEKISSDLDAVVVGMHAKADNPELIKAKELGLKVQSFPAFIADFTKDKQRVVISGSHGKTTITSMVMHVLKKINKPFGYLVGAKVEGFEYSVNLNPEAQIMIIEGDEYFTSPDDLQAKFLKYEHHTAFVSGIAWDHINVYPTEESYLSAFHQFIYKTPKGGYLVYNNDDKLLSKLIDKKSLEDSLLYAYGQPKYKVKDGVFSIKSGDGVYYPMSVIGDHNMRNIEGARVLLSTLGVSESVFFDAIKSFKGAGKRLERVENNDRILYKDFAHAPSKVKATVEAVKQTFSKKKLVAALELHTFSSLNPDFISQYKDTLKKADESFVLYDPELAASKAGTSLSIVEVEKAFNAKNLTVFSDKEALLDRLKQVSKDDVLLIMSSGDLGNIDFQGF